MKRFGLKYSSIGFISHYLNTVGSMLPSTLTNEENTVKLVVFASDEIFSNNMPILVTVDPVSSAILRIELSNTRKAKDWVKHWQCIEDNGYTAIYLVSDEVTGLTSGHSHGLSDRKFQPDTFHAIAHKLGIWVERFEKKAYQAIEEEYYRLRVFDSAKSDVVIAKRIKAYESAVVETTKQFEIYEDFVYLYSNYEVTKYQVYDKLNSIVQSSAMVECINSIIRPYLNASRNHITQEMLNLIMFYHNHRRYKSGERSGKTPYELLSGKPQGKDWIELFFEKIGKIPTPAENLFNKSLAQEKECEMPACNNMCDDYVISQVAS